MTPSPPPSLPLTASLILYVSASIKVRGGKREGNILPRTVHKAHRFTARHSKGLADDLRVTFGAVLVSTPQSAGSSMGTGSGLKLLSSREQQYVLGNLVVYCKPGGPRLGEGNSGGDSSGPSGNMWNVNGNSNGNGGGTSTMSGGNGGNHTDSTSSTSFGDRPMSTGGGGGGGGAQTTTSAQVPTATPVNNNSPFKIGDSHSGSKFFNGWNFWTFGDPASGIVNYVVEATARANSLLEINSTGNAIMRVETTPQVFGKQKK
ncbi:hypothetical protein PQX77_001553, partial [Marasmius sp. AFHP31]